MKYFLHLAYKGTNYHGWQWQPNVNSVQEVIETALAKMLGKEKVSIGGCGRTDAGVHASQYYAQVRIEKELDFDPVFRLNKMLPADIVVFDLIPVEENQHAQHQATSRTYTYYFHNKANPFINDVSTFVEGDLDFEKMKAAVALLKKYKNYHAFCKQPDLYPHHNCDIKEAFLEIDETTHRHFFKIKADRFLRSMIRLLMGNLFEIGKGKMSLAEFEHCLKSGEAPTFFREAFPQGLFLSGVAYAFI